MAEIKNNLPEEELTPEETPEEPLTPEKETELEEDPAGEETAVDGEDIMG